MAQYVYTLRRVGKTVPPKRQILKNISLNFFPGAKIGVLGLNGSGKSTLLKIMAGVETNFEGEVTALPNMKIGFLPQEPQLDPVKTVREAVEEGLGETLAAKKRLDEIYAAYAEPDADFDKLAAEQAELEAIVNATHSDSAALRAENRAALRRRKKARGAVPPVALQARHPAARRAHQSPRCGKRRVARAVSAEVSRYRGRGDARPLLPRQRGAVDPRARPRLRHSLGGQLLVVVGAEGKAPRDRGEAGAGAHQVHAKGAGMGAAEPEGPPGEIEGAAGALRRAFLL